MSDHPLCAQSPLLRTKRKLPVDDLPVMAIVPNDSTTISSDPLPAVQAQDASAALPEPATPSGSGWPSQWKLGESSKPPRLAATAAGPSSPKRPRTDAFAAAYAPRRTKSESSPRRRRRSSRADEQQQQQQLAPDHAHPLFQGCPFSFNSNSYHIPALHPPVNRTTLKDLELDSILRNPQLRHDLLFDSGLQFRPTSGRTKHDVTEGYWTALLQELETGCTCVSFDYDQQPTKCLCACSQFARPPVQRVFAFSRQFPVVTVRMPSRIKPLLTELNLVLLSIIQPLGTGVSGVYMQEPTTGPAGARHQVVQHAAQAAALRAALDPDLIVQEIEHKLFDPSGLFRVVGEVLKCHCAPMRDQAVDAVIAAAQRCAPGAGGSYADAVLAMRMLFTVLETMKLDIANHQLQTLRPYLIQSSAEFELRLFEERFKGLDALARTRTWLQRSLADLMAANTPIYAGTAIRFLDCTRSMQLRIAALAALVRLVFEPVAAADHTLDIPETLHLDHARVHEIGAACADTTALYMHLMLFRQLALARPTTCAACKRVHAVPPVDTEDLSRVKRDTWELGPSKPGTMLWRDAASERERARWERKTRAAALQVARRATQLRACPCTSAEQAEAVPSQETVELAESWALTNLRRGSALAGLMRTRLRDAVLDVLMVALVHAGDYAAISEAILGLPSIHAGGLETLLREIKHLADRIWRLSNVHINVYGSLYEMPSFFDA